jgi:Second Messenger Oligonucleotide or Dinucleotide Synthetase domain
MAARDFNLNDVRDVLLADVAIRIQLPPSSYQLATDRVAKLATWLDRADSSLKDGVSLVYPQGSMAINATIGSCLDRDEFDIDTIAQLVPQPGRSPQQALDQLYLAIKGAKGSRYHEMVQRNTRCITVLYADMHVDLTPAELIPGGEPRLSVIFHHRPEEPASSGRRVIANPFGFAEWFNYVTPRSASFEAFYEAQSRTMDRVFVAKDAAVEDIPDQTPAYRKPPAVVALQLIKRFRNVRYESRKGRRPPSVMLARLIAESGSPRGKPFDELLFQARKLENYFAEHQRSNTLVRVVNPRCSEDVFTDRWPTSLDEQQMFLTDLVYFRSQLQQLEQGADLEKISTVFSTLFGETVSRSVITKFADRSGQTIATGQLRSERGTGRIDISHSRIGTVAATTAAASQARSSPRHTFYGLAKK